MTVKWQPENAEGTLWSATVADGRSRPTSAIDPDNQPRQPAVGCATHSRRAAETWYRHRSVDCRQVHVTASRPSLPDDQVYDAGAADDFRAMAKPRGGQHGMRVDHRIEPTLFREKPHRSIADRRRIDVRLQFLHLA